jgi:heptosyltransferase-2
MLAEIRRIIRTGKGGHRKRMVASALHAIGWPIFLLPRLFWPPRKVQQGPLPDDARVLLIRVDGIGDLAMTSMIFPALRRRFPRGCIELLTSSAAKPIAELLVAAGWVDALHVLPLLGRTLALHWKMAGELRTGRYHAAIDLRGDLRNILVMWLAGIPRRIGLPGSGWTYLLTDVVELSGERLHHQSDESRALVRQLGVTELDASPCLPLREEDLASADAWLTKRGVRTDHPICAFHLGAFQPSKVWPIERFVEVAQSLHREFDAQVLVVGSGEEAELASRFASQLPDFAFSAAGDTSLTVSAALLHRCAVLIGNDSGPAHLGTAVGCPVVVLFGPAPPERYRPLGKSVVLLRSPRPCEPGCDKVCVRPAEHCLLDVTVDEVARAAAEFVRRHAARPSPAEHDAHV